MNEIRIIDTHCHLDFKELKNRLDSVIKDAKIHNVTDMVTISTNLSRIDQIKEISEKYEEVFFTVGYIRMKHIKTNNLMIMIL